MRTICRSCGFGFDVNESTGLRPLGRALWQLEGRPSHEERVLVGIEVNGHAACVGYARGAIEQLHETLAPSSGCPTCMATGTTDYNDHVEHLELEASETENDQVDRSSKRAGKRWAK